jgi:hypothetical protein
VIARGFDRHNASIASFTSVTSAGVRNDGMCSHPSSSHRVVTHG